MLFDSRFEDERKHSIPISYGVCYTKRINWEIMALSSFLIYDLLR